MYKNLCKLKKISTHKPKFPPPIYQNLLMMTRNGPQLLTWLKYFGKILRYSIIKSIYCERKVITFSSPSSVSSGWSVAKSKSQKKKIFPRNLLFTCLGSNSAGSFWRNIFINVNIYSQCKVRSSTLASVCCWLTSSILFNSMLGAFSFGISNPVKPN